MTKKNNKNIKLWKTIENWGTKGVGDAHRKGYNWVKKYFVPTLIKAESIGKSNRNKLLISDSYYVLGDIHDFNNAPLAAIKAYQKSIELCPSSGAWREMGNMYAYMGRRKKAIKCLKKALSIDSKDEFAQTDLHYLRDESTDTKLFFEGDIFWQVNELLANNLHDDALSLIKKKNSLNAMLHRARVYGAKNDQSKYLSEWMNLTTGKKRFELKYADWFYLPNCMWDSPDFWNCMIGIFHRLRPGVAVYDESLSMNYHHELKRKKGQESQATLLMFQFNYYRCKKDTKKITELHKKYPKWKAPIKELNKN